MKRRIGAAAEAATVLLVLALFVFLLVKIRDSNDLDLGPYVETPDESLAPHGNPDAYAFTKTDPESGEPVRFNPCETLHYVINVRSAPARAEEMVHAAIQVVSEGTGIEFSYDGLTDERLSLRAGEASSSTDRSAYQPERYGDRWAPLIFLWDRIDASVPDGWPDGAGGPSLLEAGTNRRYVTGHVVIESRPGRRPVSTPLVLLHETLHVMGLAHVTDSQQIMDHDATGPARLGAGDREGLRRLGRDAGCLPPVKPR